MNQSHVAVWAHVRETGDGLDWSAFPANLDDVFCQEEERKVSNDWVVQYGPRWFQIAEEPHVPAGSTILVRQPRDGGIRLVWQQVELQWRELKERPKNPEPAKPARREQRPNIPSANHPWRAYSKPDRSLQC